MTILPSRKASQRRTTHSPCRLDAQYPAINTTVAAIMLSSSLLLGSAVQANPTGATVTHGQVSIQGAGSGQMQIRASDGSIINWQNFSIGAGEVTRFIQPSAVSRVLNRVSGGAVSRIDGSLLANGRVYLINPNGVVFGSGSVVDTAGLVASTLGLSDEAFMAGVHEFAGAGVGEISNHGYIRTSGKGDVVLIAPAVTNEGLIETQSGDLILAAGERVVLTSLDVDHVSYEVSANRGEVVNLGELLTRDGAIGLFARQLKVAGQVQANHIQRDDSGRIQLVAAQSNEVTGQLAVRGGQNSISIDGRSVAIQPGASATTTANGRIDVFGDDSVYVGGRLSSENGFIETSTAGAMQIDQAPDVGSHGMWLIDPTDIEITQSAPDNAGDPLNITGDRVEISAQVIADGLNGGGEVVLTTRGTDGEGKGDITVSAPVRSDGGGKLSLIAANDINVNRPIAARATDITLDANGVVRVSADVNGKSINASGSRIDVRGANINMRTDSSLEAANVAVTNSAVAVSDGRLNVNAAQSVSLNRSSQLSAARNINLNTLTLNMEAGAEVVSAADVNVRARTQVTAVTAAGNEAQIKAADQVVIRTPALRVDAPKGFQGRPFLQGRRVVVDADTVNCNGCELADLVDGTLSTMADNNNADDDADSQETATQEATNDVVALIDTAETDQSVNDAVKTTEQPNAVDEAASKSTQSGDEQGNADIPETAGVAAESADAQVPNEGTKPTTANDDAERPADNGADESTDIAKLEPEATQSESGAADGTEQRPAADQATDKEEAAGVSDEQSPDSVSEADDTDTEVTAKVDQQGEADTEDGEQPTDGDLSVDAEEQAAEQPDDGSATEETEASESDSEGTDPQTDSAENGESDADNDDAEPEQAANAGDTSDTESLPIEAKRTLLQCS